ncbi:hypothetical protein RRG08_026570 [Elysia crispata]|uniref:Uncharacterized protein n=1 Tax=Elysia crispata TaxID=231223 RepID=A0AAE0Y4E8_9GAST|nr:hypothetical protein RRG08_026570 [Elysia crispata]
MPERVSWEDNAISPGAWLHGLVRKWGNPLPGLLEPGGVTSGRENFPSSAGFKLVRNWLQIKGLFGIATNS